MKRKYWYLIFATILTIMIWLQLKLLEHQSTNENTTLISTVIEPHSVVETIARRTIPLIPIQFDDSSLSIFPQRVTIIIEGEADLLNSLTVDDFVAYIPNINFTEVNEAEILFILPENVKVIDITPQRVTVNVK